MPSFATRWYVACFCREALPVFPVYALMMTRSGIAPLQLATLFIVWSGTAAIAEVPTGVIADRVERRWLLAAACLLRSAAFLLWLLAPQFWGYLTGFVLWGIGSSLWSGTAEALLYETLAERRALHTFPTIYAGGAAAANVGIGTALAVGGWLATFGFALPLLLSAALPLVTVTLLLKMFGDPPRTMAADGATSPAQSLHPPAQSLRPQTQSLQSRAQALRPQTHSLHPLAQALRDFRRSPAIRELALIFAAVLVFFGVFDEYVTLLLDARGISLPAIGVTFAACYALRAVGMAAAGRLPTLRPLPVLALAGAALLVALIAGSATAIATGCLLYFGLNGVAEVRAGTELQTTMDGAARATVTSLTQFGPHITGMAIYLCIGWLATGRDYLMAAWVAGLGTTLFAGLLWLGSLRRARGP